MCIQVLSIPSPSVCRAAPAFQAAARIIAIQDRNRHNRPPYAWNVCKLFLFCEVKGGSFKPNNETVESRYFAQERLPEPDEAKNSAAQISLCFAAYHPCMAAFV
ncbi:MAG: hypothetical protein NC112_01145 [Oxalobacter formigenes]|nr:hypothetical protein [Oxalobacter formigenes]